MNLILIGMPGCGKSTCGILAAKWLCMSFLDTDLLIQQNEGKKLQDIINEKGGEYFAKAEEDAIVTLYARSCVIATGGSVVYSEQAMEHLKENGKVVYLKISRRTMHRRIHNPRRRGILLEEGKTLDDMYFERAPIYEKYADAVVECDGNSVDDTVSTLVEVAEKLLGKNDD